MASGAIGIVTLKNRTTPWPPAGAGSTTAQHFVSELQQDWSRQETYQGVIDIMKAHTAFGTQIFFSKWALGGHDSA